MSMDANYQSVPPAQSMRINNFKLKPISFGTFPIPFFPIVSTSGFFADNLDDKNQWKAPYSQILGYSDVETMLNAYFKGNFIAEWTRFLHRHRPRSFENII